MKVLTQNLHCFAEENHLEKFDRIAQFIVDNDIDVACFQEVAQHVVSPMIKDEMLMKEGNAALLIRDKIKALSGIEYELFFSFAHYYYGTDEEGVAILTKQKPIEWKEHVISDVTEITIDRRTAIEVIFENGLSISSLHLGIATDAVPVSPALSQFQKLGTLTTGETKLYFGDYNIIDETDDYSAIVESGYFDLAGENAKGNPDFKTTPGVIDGWRNSEHSGAKRIDYGFANQVVEVKDAHVVFDGRSDAMVSDHFGMYFELEI